ncbi:MAG: methyltransferase domain-containing protein [Nanoarchaeota archaeon]|nr:methyltransferase domain-containing protein [Nanoarchaeota archaeon]
MTHKGFDIIKGAYDSSYSDLLRRGKIPARDTKIGFWGPSVTHEVYEAFKKIQLSRSKRFLDLGSGDGKVAMLASLFCSEAHGVEYDGELHERAEKMASQLGISNVAFFNRDFHDHSLSEYDAVFINPDKPMARGTEKKLVNELNGRLIVYGHHFHPTSLKKQRSFVVGDTPITVFKK